LETLHRAGLRPVDDAIWHAWAVRAGHALSSDVLSVGANPLELGLREWIGWSKGCYIGQEVIARLDTYDKVRRRRAIIESSGIGPGRGTALEIDGRKRGIALTSAKEPGEEDFVTLALLDRSIEVGATLRWEDEGAGTVAAIPAP
jgi:folate-binding protein YgfZ